MTPEEEELARRQSNRNKIETAAKKTAKTYNSQAEMPAWMQAPMPAEARQHFYEAGKKAGLPSWSTPEQQVRAAVTAKFNELKQQKMFHKNVMAGGQGVYAYNYALDDATRPFNDDDYLNAARDAVLNEAFGVQDDPEKKKSFSGFAPLRVLPDMNKVLFETTVGSVDKYIYAPISHALAAGAVYTDSESSAHGDWEKAWDSTDDVSFGQAIIANDSTLDIPVVSDTLPGKFLTTSPGVILGPVSRGLNSLFGQDTDVENVGDLDVASEADRAKLKQYTTGTWGGKLTSGAADVGVAVFADPLVYAGKFVKGAQLFRKGQLALTEAKRTSDLLNLADGLKEYKNYELAKSAFESGKMSTKTTSVEWFGKTATKTTEKAVKPEPLLSPAAKRIRYFTEQTNHAKLKNHPEIRESAYPEALASIYARTNVADDVVTLMRVTRGDPEAVLKLKSERLHVADQLNDMREAADALRLQRRLGIKDPAARKDWFENEGKLRLDMADKLVKDMAKEDEHLAQLVGQRNVDEAGKVTWTGGVVSATEGMEGSGFQLTGLQEDFGQKRAAWRGENEFRSTRFEGVFGTAVNVVHWAGREAPSGWIKIAGASDVASAGPEFRAWLNSVPLLNRLGTEGESLKRGFYKQYVDAAAQGDAAVGEAVKTIERSIMERYANHVGRKAGLKGKQLDEWTADKLLETQQWQTGRQAKSLQMANNRGYFYDKQSKELLTVPQFETQLAGRMPLLDFGVFDKFSRGTMGTRRVRAAQRLEQANRGIQQLWRTSVLMRFGYTQRNVMEGNARAFAIAGVSHWHPMSLAYLAPNSGIRVARGAARLTKAERRAERRASDAVLKDINSPEGASYASRALDADKEGLKDWLDPDDLNLMDRLSLHLRAVAQTPLKRNSDRDLKLFTSDGEKRVLPGITGDPVTKDAMFKNLSSEDMYDFISNVRHGAYSKAHQRVNHIANTNVSSKQANYFDASAEYANRYLRGSNLARLRLTGASDEDFVKFIRSAEGRGLAEFAKQTGHSLEDIDDLRKWFKEGRKTLLALYPDDVVRQHIIDGKEVTADFLKARLGSIKNKNGGKLKLPDVVGSKLLSEDPTPLAPGGPLEQVQGVIRGAWRLLGSIPEDKLVRMPYGDTVYRNTLKSLVSSHDAEFVAEHYPQLVRIAQRNAVKRVRKDLYTVERYSNLVRGLEVVSPFINAKLNTAKAWGRIIANDPSVAVRAYQLWNAPKAAGLEDDQGNLDLTDFVNAIPGLPELPDGYRLKLPKKNVASIILGQGNDKLQEGAEALFGEGSGTTGAATLASMVLPESGFYLKPVLDAYVTWRVDTADPGKVEKWIMDYLMPYGPTQRVDSAGDFVSDALTANLPSWTRDLKRLAGGVNDTDYAARSAAVQYDMQLEALRRGEDPLQTVTPEKVADRVKFLYLTDMIGKFVSPGAIKTESPFKAILDQRNKWYDEGKDATEVSRLLNEKFGEDAAILMGGTSTRNSMGVPATRAAVQWIQNNKDLVAKAAARSPEDLRLLFAGLPELQGQYDPVANRLLQGMEIPGMSGQTFAGKVNFNDVQAKFEKDQGFKAYGQYKAWKEKKFTEAKQQFGDGLTRADLSSKAEKDALSAWWDKMNLVDAQMRDRLGSDFKAWSEETKYNQENPQKPQTAIGILTTVTQSPNWDKIRGQSPVYWDSVLTYLEVRKRAQRDLDAAGVPDISKEKFPTDEQKLVIEEVRAKVKGAVDQLSAKSVAFADVYKKWFTNDEYNSRYWE